MCELNIDASLVGRDVCNPARPEWGVGRVLRVQATSVGGRPVHRVSVQFVTGHRQLVVPPARLVAPAAEPARAAGWLDTIGGRTVDDRLASLPSSVTEALGTPVQRLALAIPLYEWQETPRSIQQWARRQAQVADPLSLWSQDELLIAFRKFCDARDSHLRMLAALLKEREGPAALRTFLAGVPEHVRGGVEAALRRPI